MGEGSKATGAGSPVLYAVRPCSQNKTLLIRLITQVSRQPPLLMKKEMAIHRHEGRIGLKEVVYK